MNKDDIPVFPVASISVGPLMSHGAITIRLDFLTHPLQAPEDANAGRHYALTPPQARALIEQIGRALAKLESGPPQGTGLPKH